MQAFAPCFFGFLCYVGMADEREGACLWEWVRSGERSNWNENNRHASCAEWKYALQGQPAPSPPAGRSGALSVVARCSSRLWKGKSVSIHGYYSSFHYTLLYMVLGYEQVVLLGRTDGIIPPINTTQPIHFLRATCGPSVCGIYFNMNHTNLTNCAGVNLQLGKNSIRVSLTRPLGGSTPRD